VIGKISFLKVKGIRLYLDQETTAEIPIKLMREELIIILSNLNLSKKLLSFY